MAALLEEAAAAPSAFAVVGVVRWRDGDPAAGVTVSAFDRDMREEQELGLAETDETGTYRIDYVSDNFARADKSNADLRVRVTLGSQTLYDPPLSSVLFDAPPIVVIDIALAVPDPHAASEFDRLSADLAPLAGDVLLDQLRQDAEAQDVTFLAAETGVPPVTIAHFGVAQKLASVRKIPASFFYALLRTGTVADAGVSGAAGVRFGIDVNTDLTPLYYDIALLDPSAVKAAIGQAVAGRMVSRAAAKELQAALERLAADRPEAEAYRAKETRNQLAARAQEFVTAGAAERVLSVLSSDAFGDLPGLVAKLGEAATVPENPARASGTTLLGHDELADTVRQERGLTEPAEVRDLARLAPAQWREAGLPDEQASALARLFEGRYPTTAFAAQLERDEEGLGPHRAAVLEVLAADPGFDLAHGNLRSAPGAGRLSDEARQGVLATQRVFKLAPVYRQANALLTRRIGSAAQIKAMGETRFVADAVDSGAFTAEQARATYHKAADVHLASALLAGQLATGAAALAVPGLGDRAALTRELSAVTDDFPNLKSLFQLADSCVCEECRTVHSAAAYLVDVLEFLRQRLVTDTTAPGPALKVARDVLFARRPDLGDLDLDCANTNTELPYIDLVCELLEEAVAPETGVPFSGALTAGAEPVEVPTAALLAALQGAGWPFTAQALVYQPDLAGARVARDAGVVVKIVPDGADWKVVRLHHSDGTAADLLAAPEYVNPGAYAALAAAKYAFTLPYDLVHQETVSYLGQFDLPRVDLMIVLRKAGNPADATIAAERLGLTDAQRKLVVTPAPGDQDTIWNTAPLGPLGGIARIDNLLSRAQLDYPELAELLTLEWLNPGGALYIQHLDATCDTAHKVLHGLDKAALDRLHRFLRLQRACGWTPAQLNRALGSGALDDPFLVKLAGLIQLQATADALALFCPLDDDQYAQLFLNPGANGPIDDAFRPANLGTKKLADHEAYLAVCFGLSVADTDRLVTPFGAGALITAANLTLLYARTVLMRALHLDAANYLALAALTGTDPLTSPAAGLAFAGTAATVAAAGTTPLDLTYLLTHTADDLAQRDLPDDRLTAILTGLRTDLQAAWARTRPDVDPARLPEENLPGLRALLSLLPGLSADDLAAFDAVVTGTFVGAGQTAAQFVDATLGALVDATTVKTKLTANPTQAQQNAAIVAIADAVSRYFYDLASHDLAVEHVAADFTLGPVAAEALLGTGELRDPATGRTLLDLLTDDSLLNQAVPLAPAAFDLQYRALRLLHVATQLITGLHIPDDRVDWLLRTGPGLGWLAPDRLPYQSPGTAVPLAAWLRLAGGLDLARRWPPVPNPADPDNPWTAWGLFETADVPGYLAALAGLDEGTLTDLATYFGWATWDPDRIERLVDAAAVLRRLGLDLATTLPLTAPVTTAAEAATMRRALKARYSDADWPGVLRAISDRVRLGKREALVAYLLAVNPSLRGPDDLYDYFLIDVEMAPCMPTSRIVQAHATLQLFVQRCLMGLEPHSVAAIVTTRPGSSGAGWPTSGCGRRTGRFSSSRRTGSCPICATDKSELFADLDNQLQQDALTDCGRDARPPRT